MRQLQTVVFSAALLLAGTSTLSAYEHTYTCGGQSGIRCAANQKPVPLFWNRKVIDLSWNNKGIPGIPLSELSEATLRSTESWNEVACTSIRLRYTGSTTDTRIGYFQGRNDNRNLIVYRKSGWNNAQYQPSMIAITLVTHNQVTGEIVDADMEFNGEHYTFTVDPNQSTMTNYLNTFTHELGHVFGLAHSEEPQATMFAKAELGEMSKITLHKDDKDGLCAIYAKRFPSSGDPTVVPDTPGRIDDEACSVRRIRSTRHLPLAILAFGVIVLGAVAWFRYRRGFKENFCKAGGKDACETMNDGSRDVR